MNSFTRRLATGTAAVALVATGAVGALAAFSDSETVSEQVTAGTIFILENGDTRALSSSAGGDNINSTWTGDTARNTFTNGGTLDGSISLTAALTAESDFSADGANLDEDATLAVTVLDGSCDAPGAELASFVAAGADGFALAPNTFDVPAGAAICVEHTLSVTNADNDAQGDSFTVDLTVSLSEV